MNYHEHKRETFSVFWNQTTKDTFVSSSWDGTVKIVWHPSHHADPTHSTSLSPASLDLLTSPSLPVVPHPRGIP